MSNSHSFHHLAYCVFLCNVHYFYFNFSNCNFFPLWLPHSVLSENNFFGVIPKEVGRLRRLEVLDLTNNNLSGRIPAEIGDLHSLRSLWVHNLIFVHISGHASCISLYMWVFTQKNHKKMLSNFQIPFPRLIRNNNLKGKC